MTVKFLPNTREDIYWDTCLFYEYFGKEKISQERLEGLQGVMREVEEGKSRIVTSLMTQLEVIPTHMDSKSAGAAKRFMDAFDDERMIAVEVSPNIITKAREIRDYYYVPPMPAKYRTEKGKKIIVEDAKAARTMDLGDCIHVASAIQFGISTLHTRDGASKSAKKRLTNIPILDLADNEEALICGKYPLIICQPTPHQTGLYDGIRRDEEE